MNEELRIVIRAVTEQAERSMAAVREQLEGIQDTSNESGKSVNTTMAGIAKGAAAAVAAITALTAAMVALGKSAQQVQKGFDKLNTTFRNAGSTTTQASKTYQELFRFLGDHDRAIETAQSLALISNEEEKLAEWTNILQGAFAEMGDKLPIEGLAEAANETINTGVVTGVFADALNWAKVSEDGFNEALAQTVSLEEREALIRNTLNSLYGNSAKLYEKNSQATLRYNESQARLNMQLAQVSGYTTPLLTSLNELSTVLLSALTPALQTVAIYLTAFIQLMAEAVVWVGEFFGLFSSNASESAADMEGYQAAMKKYQEQLRAAFGKSNNETEEQIDNLKELKKQVMGFDELNVVNSQTTTSSSTGGGGGGAAVDVPEAPNPADYGIGIGSVDFDAMSKSLEEARDVLKKILALVGGIAGSFALWKIGSFLKDLIESYDIVNKLKKLNLDDIWNFLNPKETESFLFLAGLKEKLMKPFAGLITFFKSIGTAISGAAKAAGAFIAGLSAGTIALIVAIVAALASAIYFVWKNWDAVVQTVKDFFADNIAPKLEDIKNLFADIGEAIGAIWDALPKGLTDWLKNVWQSVKDVVAAIGEWFASIEWLKGIGAVVEWLGGFVTGILGGVIGGAINALVNFIKGFVQNITGWIQLISGLVSGLINLIVGLFTGDFSKALDSAKLIWDGIVNIFKGAYNTTIGLVTEFVEGIIDFFIDLGVNSGMIFSDMVEDIKKPFANIADWFKNIFSKAWENVKNVFSSGGKIFDGIKSGISNVFTTVVNGLITGINKVISVPFNKINGILNFIRNIEVIGLKPFIDLWKQNPLAVPQIPKLATGGIVNSSTLANIGENGKEAVLPLEHNTGWMDTLADRIASRNSAPTRVVLQVDGRELGYATINSINGITQQTGTLQLAII